MRRSRVAVAALVLSIGAALAGTAGAGTAAPLRQEFTIYSVATAVQFINNADDRARGAINNPFDTATNKLQPKTKQTGTGPAPGDVTIYTFDLYTGKTRHVKAGTAAYTCYYNYASHALCQAYYELSGQTGTLIASGPIDFTKTTFTLVVTGGTNKYNGARGELSAVPAPQNAQRLDFTLLG